MCDCHIYNYHPPLNLRRSILLCSTQLHLGLLRMRQICVIPTSPYRAMPSFVLTYKILLTVDVRLILNLHRPEGRCPYLHTKI